MLNNIKKGTNSVYIFNEQGHMFFNIKTRGVRTDIRERYQEWIQKAKKAQGRPVLLSTQEVEGPLDKKRYVFTVVRDIISVYGYRSIGTIAVDANIKVIESAVNNLDEVTKGTTLIVDANSNVIYDSEQQKLAQNIKGDPLLEKAKGKEGTVDITLDGKNYLAIYKTPDEIDSENIHSHSCRRVNERFNDNQLHELSCGHCYYPRSPPFRSSLQRRLRILWLT